MKKCKHLVLILALVLVVSLLAGCGGSVSKSTETTKKDDTRTTEDPNLVGNFYKTGLPIVKEKITLKMMAGKPNNTTNFDEIETFRELEERTNIRIEWDLVPQQAYTDRKGIILASGEYPDAFFGTAAGGITDEEAVSYGSQGVFIPMESYIEEYAVNLKNVFAKLPDAKRIATALDGHIYTLPFIQQINANTVFTRMFINKSWIERLGLSLPETTDELYQVLKAFKERDPNGNNKADEIPFSFIYKNHNMGHYGLMGSFGCPDTRDHVALKDGKVYITATTPEYKEAVKFLNKLYDEGLIDSEAFTHDSSQYRAKGNQEDALYGFYFDWGGTSVVGVERFESDYVPLAPLKGPKGHQMWLVREPTIWGGYFAITSANKHVEATIRWVDELYEEKTSMQLQYGPIGLTLEETPDGKIKMLDPPDGMTYNDFRYQKAPAITASCILAETFENKMIVNETILKDDALYQVYAPYLLDEFYPTASVKFTKEENTKMADLKTDIITYIDNKQAAWITGESSIDDEWDEYLKELEKMEIEEMRQLYQDVYDRYMGK
ncbi:MAG: extracellular solute-binding protein [Clostridiaceae bacterium]|nr:extracellular solute-binding protein [Clostridiaceae bacterium]